MSFSHFFIKRMLHSIFVLIGLSILIFIIARMLPGDPARLALGPFAAEEQVQRLQEQMGMHKPLPVQYISYITGAIQGDLGLSFQTRRNVALDIAHYLPATIELVAVASFWVLIFGVPLGMLAARYKDGFIDNGVRIISFVGVAIPPFVAGLALQLIFSYLLGVLPTTGRLSIAVQPPTYYSGLILVDSILDGNYPAFINGLRHIILPSFAIALTGIGQVARLTRASASDVINQDYIETARGFGIPDRRVLYKYVFKPSSIPPITILGLTFASELSNAFLVETVFAWPGLASYGIRAILRKDFNSVMGVVLIIGIAFLIVNIVVDIIAGYLDPRIRITEEEGSDAK